MAEHTPGPWEYVPATEHHGPYVVSQFGSDIADCYTMTRPDLPSTINGGPSKPVPFMAEMAEPNARLIAAAPELLERVESSNVALEEAAKLLDGRGLAGCARIMRSYTVGNHAAIAKARGQ